MSKIQLRQVYRDQLYNYRPTWILRWGITIFFVFLLLVISVSGFIRYPDIVPATVEITTINPPANLISKVNGKIEIIFAEEGESITKGQVLAILESPAQWKDMKILDHYITVLENTIGKDSLSVIPEPDFLRNDLELGEVQGRYADLKLNYTELYNFLHSGLFEEEVLSLQEKKQVQKQLLLQENRKRELLKAQIRFADKEYQRDSILFVKEVISESEIEQRHQNRLQFQSSLVDMEVNILNIKSSLKQLRSDLKKIELKHNTDRQELTNKLLQSTHLLKAQTETWKQNYLITTPIDGKVSFTIYWSKNQNVKSGELIFSVVPIDSMTTKARLQFPIQNSGKIKEGQQVNIKLQNYPYQEFGMLVGHLSKISEVPNELLYSADVVLDKGLITSYGKRLPKVQQLKGDAEILTDDLSLLMRFFNPLRAIFDHRLRKHNQ